MTTSTFYDNVSDTLTTGGSVTAVLANVASATNRRTFADAGVPTLDTVTVRFEDVFSGGVATAWEESQCAVVLAAGIYTLTRTLIISSTGSLLNLTTSATATIVASSADLLALKAPAWITKTANYTAVAGDKIIADTTGGAFTVTLPASPTDGQEVVVRQFESIWGTNVLTIERNGNSVDGVAANPVLGGNASQVSYVWDNASTTWISNYTRVGLYAECVLSSNYTLTSQTAAQKLLNSTANGAVTLEVGTYKFECRFGLTGLSSSSSSFGFALGGSASFTQGWLAEAQKTSSLTGGGGNAANTWNAAANTAIAQANSNTAGVAIIEGVIRVTVAGTVIPQVSLGIAAAAVVQAGACFEVSRVSQSATATTIGPWS